jgi:2-dehydro-3-deoxygluconokinase
MSGTDPSSPSGVVTIGESMVLLQPMSTGPLAYAPLFTRSIAGAEANVAIGLSRLGRKVRWIGRVGNDPFGDIILSTLAGEGVDISMAERDPQYPTAVYFKEFKRYGDPNVYYYRKGSAASRLSPEHVKPEWFEGARHLHVTGITPALGQHTADAVKESMVQARQMGLTVSFDPNLRRKLWDDELARQTLLSLIPYCDLFLPGLEEAEFLLGERTEEEYGTEFRAMGPKAVVIKLGERGAVGFVAERVLRADPYPISRVVDTVGAGDAFAAGLLSGLLDADWEDAETFESALKTANTLGALATQFNGDWEGLPKSDELARILSGRDITR